MSSDLAAADCTSVTDPWGKICWLEIPIFDQARAAAFYREVLEWKCLDAGEPTEAPGIKTIYGFQKDDFHGAFLLLENEGQQIRNYDPTNKECMPVHATFCVKSIDDAVVKVEKFGGKVHVGKTAIGGENGCFARIIDCEGNMIGIWSQN